MAELQNIYVNFIIGVMSQDMIDPRCEIGQLHGAVKKRIDAFDLYFEQIEKETFKGPF